MFEEVLRQAVDLLIWAGIGLLMGAQIGAFFYHPRWQGGPLLNALRVYGTAVFLAGFVAIPGLILQPSEGGSSAPTSRAAWMGVLIGYAAAGWWVVVHRRRNHRLVGSTDVVPVVSPLLFWGLGIFGRARHAVEYLLVAGTTIYFIASGSNLGLAIHDAMAGDQFLVRPAVFAAGVLYGKVLSGAMFNAIVDGTSTAWGTPRRLTYTLATLPIISTMAIAEAAPWIFPFTWVSSSLLAGLGVQLIAALVGYVLTTAAPQSPSGTARTVWRSGFQRRPHGKHAARVDGESVNR